VHCIVSQNKYGLICRMRISGASWPNLANFYVRCRPKHCQTVQFLRVHVKPLVVPVMSHSDTIFMSQRHHRRRCGIRKMHRDVVVAGIYCRVSRRPVKRRRAIVAETTCCCMVNAAETQLKGWLQLRFDFDSTVVRPLVIRHTVARPLRPK